VDTLLGLSADPTHKPKSGPIPVIDTSSDEIHKLEAEAAALKDRLDDVTAKLLKAIAGKEPRPHIQALEGSPPRFRPRRVLIIEDENDARDFLKNLVSRLGHVVEVAENGVDGLAKFQTFRPEVALIDLGLPGLDGYSVARQVRAAMGKEVPLLVAYTAYAGGAIRAAALAAGFDRHVLKPIAIDELMFLLQPQRSDVLT
jgi:CheY-like chemotaxis protein